MKLTVLGSGITTQLPGTEYRFPSAHLVETANDKILLDAGLGAIPQLAKLNLLPSDISTICITHFHADHFLLDPILQALYVLARQAGLQPKLHILGPSGIEQVVRTSYDTKGFTFDGDILPFVDVSFTEYDDGQEIILYPGLSVTPYKTAHYSLEAYSLRVNAEGKILAYSGDTTLSDGLVASAENADLFLCESSAPLESFGDAGHLSPVEAGKAAQKANAKKLVLAHYTGRDSDDAMVKDVKASDYSGDIVVAKDLDSFELN